MVASIGASRTDDTSAGGDRTGFKLQGTKFRGKGIKVSNQSRSFDVDGGEVDLKDIDIK